MMGDTIHQIIAGLIIAVAGVGLFMFLYLWGTAPKNRSTFLIACPICKRAQSHDKDTALGRAATMTAQEVLNLKIWCNPHAWYPAEQMWVTTQSGYGCGADLAPLYLQHPFVRKAFKQAAKLAITQEKVKKLASSGWW